MINHPLIEEIGTYLGIPYNFYIEGFDDMSKLLGARSYKFDGEEARGDEEYFRFTNTSKSYKLLIKKDLFDQEYKLIFVKRTDWNENDILYLELTNDDDDLPF